MEIKNIIFDLGGVLLNIDFKKTGDAFTALGVENFSQYFTQYHAHPLFKDLETGSIDDHKFYHSVREIGKIKAGNEEIDKAWNAMLLDFPMERVKKLQSLSNNYRLFLFSNTNAIHHAAFQRLFTKEFGFEFDSLFEKAWYSHLIGHRKPSTESFQFVLRDGNLHAPETLFVDDTLPNVQAASQVGLNAVLVSPEKDLLAVLGENLNKKIT